MTDEINVLALHFVGGRLNPEPSRAREARYYGDPAAWVKFGKREGAQVDRQSDKEKADTLLMEWYRWTKLYRPNLGAPKIAPYCKQSQSSKQYEDASDLTHDRVYQNEMKAVDFCVDAIAVPMQQAIGTEMRNREVRAKVWRDSGNRQYSDALALVMVVMRKRGLFD
jgi:hypothetical protein